jgi:hypothetical protein
MRLYHLLPAKWALESIQKARLKIAFFEDLNDPFEFLAFDTSDAGIDSVLNGLRSTLGKIRGILCFSKSWTNPVLWSHYGDKHRGMALGFEIPEMINGDPLGREVEYVFQRLKCTFEDIKRGGEADALRLLATKFHQWSYEEDVRIFSSINEKDQESGFCFAPFSETLQLVEVVLGVRREA